MMQIGDLIEHVVYRGTQHLAMPVGYRYLLAGNGVHIQAGNQMMDVIQPIANLNVRALPPVRSRVILHHGRVPGRLLLTALLDAQKYPGREVAYQIRPAEKNGRPAYRVVRVGIGGAASVTFDDSAHGQPVLVELHSHHSMGAFFSNIDDQDEQDLRYYVVMGRLDQAQPHVIGRMGIYGYHIPVSLDQVFDLSSVRGTFHEVVYGRND